MIGPSRINPTSKRASRIACIAVVLCLATAPTAAAAERPLPPDLRPEAFSSVKLCQESESTLFPSEACTGTGRTVLRITSRVSNHGSGPLEMRPDLPAEVTHGADCHGDGDVDIDGDGEPDDNDVWVSQWMARDSNGNGVFDRTAPDGLPADRWTKRIAGCRYYHPAHNHYHFENFARFTLLAERSPRRRSHVVRRGTKISFCVEDSNFFPGGLDLPGAPPPVLAEDPDDDDGQTGYYQGVACNRSASISGISVGWYDQYGWALSGQEINVTGVRAGTYCLRQEVDPVRRGESPRGRLRETDETNNVRQLRIAIDPAAAPANADSGTLEVQKLTNRFDKPQRCRLGPRVKRRGGG